MKYLLPASTPSGSTPTVTAYSTTPTPDEVKCSLMLLSVKTLKPPATLPEYNLRVLDCLSKNTSPLLPTFLSRKSSGLGIILILSTIGA